MTQFSPQRSRPLTPQSYEAAARRLDRAAAALRRFSSPQTPREKAALTSTIHDLSLFAQALSQRHREQSICTLEIYSPLTGPGSLLQSQLEDIHAQHRADAYDAKIPE